MKPIHVAIPLILLSLLCVPAPGAELRLGTPFSDHMVLQREMSVPVWGWGDAGEEVTVEFAGQKKTVKADADGKWILKLDPMPASAEPRALTIRSSNTNHAARVEDVLVGEVWLGSGQSNMAMAVGRCRDFEKEKAAAALPLIRSFKEGSGAAPAPQAHGKGAWVPCSPETVGSFSGTLFFFGREVHRALGVPVGLINSSVGGTPIEAWTDAGAQRAVPELKAFLDALPKPDAAPGAAGAPAASGQAAARPKAGAGRAAGARQGNIGGLFNGKIAPLIPYAIRGAVWYQGEANTKPGKGLFYQQQLPLLVTDWRARWGQGDFPFAWVQLPNFERGGEGWMLVREAMLKTLRLPHTGMAIAVDIGEANNIHPADKQEVGRRLALWALGDVYGRKVPATSGPLPATHEVRGAEIVASFTHCDGGLQAKGGELKGFVIAGEDRQWKSALARIEGDKVVAASPEVTSPVALRYAWASNPDGSLFNGAGMPASPFRTDEWPEVPDGK